MPSGSEHQAEPNFRAASVVPGSSGATKTERRETWLFLLMERCSRAASSGFVDVHCVVSIVLQVWTDKVC
jgi:hypothetical protein